MHEYLVGVRAFGRCMGIWQARTFSGGQDSYKLYVDKVTLLGVHGQETINRCIRNHW